VSSGRSSRVVWGLHVQGGVLEQPTGNDTFHDRPRLRRWVPCGIRGGALVDGRRP
ncbi:unnamed protein product, partial [Ascophyllum nodosum]